MPIADLADVVYSALIRTKLQRSSALFLLKLKEHHRVSQEAINDIVEDSRGLFVHQMERLKAGIRAKLAAEGLDPHSFGLDEVYKEMMDPFSGINTFFLQEKYYRDEFNLIVSH